MQSILERIPFVQALVQAWQQRRDLPRLLVLLAHAGDLAWLCVFPLLAFAAGVFMLGWVDQTREFYTQFARAGSDALHRTSHVMAFFLALLVWATSIWYGMRVLLARRYPSDVVPAAGEHFSGIVRTWAPRWFGYFGLLSAAFTFAGYANPVPDVASFAWLAGLHLAAHLACARLARKRYGVDLGPGMPVAACTLAIFLITLTITGSYTEGARLAGLVFLGLWLAVAVLNALLAQPILYWLALAALGGVAWFMAPVQSGFLGPKGVAVMAGVFYAVVVVRRDAFSWLIGTDAPSAGSLADRTPRATRITLGLVMLVLAAAVFGFARSPFALAELLGAMAIVFLGFSLWSLAAALVFVHIPKAFGAPSFAWLPVVMVFCVSSSNDNHALPASDVQPAVDARVPVEDDFAAWLAAREVPAVANGNEKGEAKDAPVVLVAAAGGGQRAAWWTARVLAAADEATCGAFGRRVYAISGVSGGSLGAASYAALKAQGADVPAGGKPCLAPGEFTGKVDQLLGHDHLAPVAGSMLFSDALQRFTPWPWLDNDRGHVLVQSWARAWQAQLPGDPFNATQAALYAGDTQRRVPLLMLNATSINTGRRVLATSVRFNPPDVLDLYGAGLRTAGLPLGFAVLNSARFTYVSPAGTLHAGAPGSEPSVVDRLVDGGYFDNSGAETVLDLADQLVRAGKVRRENIVVVIISNDASLHPVCGAEHINATGPWGQPVASVPRLSETTAPLDAILATRTARSTLAMQRVEASFRPAGGTSGTGCGQMLEWGLFDTNYQQLGLKGRREPALGWFVSEDSKRVIEQFSGFYAEHVIEALKNLGHRP